MKRTLASLTAGAMLDSIAAARAATSVPQGNITPSSQAETLAANLTKLGDAALKQRRREEAQA